MSVVSSPVRTTAMGSPGFRSQRKISAGTIMKKIQTLEETIESLRRQLVFTRSEEEQVSNVSSKKSIPKQLKEVKEKMPPAEAKQKKTQKSKEEEEKDKIPMPWTGVADFTTCVGLKAQYGLFIQCGKACDAKSTSFRIDNHECRFCNDCSKKCDENGKHPVGTIEERIEAGVGKYVNAKTGKKETMYIEALEKMGITKEQALESAAKRGFQIPDWMLEKEEKKRGRPATTTTTTKTTTINTKSESEGESNVETKEKKPRQPRAKKTASVATNDTPQKKNSVQSSISVDLNIDTDTNNVAITAPQEKKKRGRPAKSNTQNNVAESEMQKLIIQATEEKKKRLSIDPECTLSNDDKPNHDKQEQQKQPHEESNHEESNTNKEKKNEQDEDVIFEMFDKLIKEERNTTESSSQSQVDVSIIVPATTVEEVTKVTKGKKENTKKPKKDESEKVEKKKTTTAAAAAAADANDDTENDDDSNNDEEEEELECEEYEYDGETYGLAPNGDIYSQDGELVGKLTDGVPKIF